jgi:hypothetical protein
VKPSINITLERLKEVLSYNPETGVFMWLERKHGRPVDRPAGNVDARNGYRIITIDGVKHLAQRLAWLSVHGKLPTRLIRFQNSDRADCRISNLSEGKWFKTKYDHDTKEGKAAYQIEYRAMHREKFAQQERERKFGLSLADYSALVASQDNKCAICNCAETATRNGKVKALAVDHDHATGKVRGLLCVACNTGIGKFRDSRDLMLSAIKYLDKHSGREQVAAKLELVRNQL